MSEADAHAAQFLRANDRDRYLSTLVLPEPKRAAVTALLAFATDVAMIRERISSPPAGEIRLQWWNDALSGEGHGVVAANPLAAALLAAIAEYGLPVGSFQRLLGARRFDLYDDPMPDRESFEGYAGETNGTLLQLSAMILNGGQTVSPGDAAGHLGVAQALVGHLRALGSISAQGRIMLPLDVLEANGVNEGELFSRTESEGLEAARSQLIDMAGEHLAKARVAIAALPRAVRPGLAIWSIVARQHRALVEHAGSPFVPPAEAPDWRKIASVWWFVRRG